MRVSKTNHLIIQKLTVHYQVENIVPLARRVSATLLACCGLAVAASQRYAILVWPLGKALGIFAVNFKLLVIVVGSSYRTCKESFRAWKRSVNLVHRGIRTTRDFTQIIIACYILTKNYRKFHEGAFFLSLRSRSCIRLAREK